MCRAMPCRAVPQSFVPRACKQRIRRAPVTRTLPSKLERQKKGLKLSTAISTRSGRRISICKLAPGPFSPSLAVWVVGGRDLPQLRTEGLLGAGAVPRPGLGNRRPGFPAHPGTRPLSPPASAITPPTASRSASGTKTTTSSPVSSSASRGSPTTSWARRSSRCGR